MRILLVFLILASAMAGCARSVPPPLPPTAPAGVTETVLPADSEATSGQAEAAEIPTPSITLDEEPLQGQLPETPRVIVWRHRQAKADVAAYLKTTVRQLDYVNPGLGDYIEPDTLLVIPPVFRTDGETLSDISAQTGLSEDVLLSANPGLKPGTVLPAGTLLAMPALLIVAEDTPLSGTADLLGTSPESLLSANPDLAGQDEVLMGTVLVVPPESEER